MKRIAIIQGILLLLVLCMPSLLHAQGPGFGDDTDDVPIDGGLSLLIAAGAGYGIKRMSAKNKNLDPVE